MARTYMLSPRAEADLEEIWLYTAQEWSSQQAEAYTNDIIDAFEDIAAGRKPGSPALVRDGYRKVSVGRHSIYFQIRGDSIAIIRVLHQSMDIDQHL